MNPSDNYLIHYGILGMKWGVRRYQYKDGTLTPAGRRRYAGDRVIATGDRYEITVPRRAKLTEDDMRQLVSFIDMNRRLDDLSTDSSARARREAKRDLREAQKRADQQQRRKERREDRQRREDRRQQQKNNPPKKQPDVKKGEDSADKIISRFGNLLKVGTTAIALYKGFEEVKEIRARNSAREATNAAKDAAKEAAKETARATSQAYRQASRSSHSYDPNDISRYATLALPSGSKRKRRR